MLVNDKYQKYYEELFGSSTDTDVYDFTDIRTCIQSELNSISNESSLVVNNLPIEKDINPFHECKEENGAKKYYNEKGQFHRTDGPAIERK
jgi:hypothetical protein